MHGSSHLVISFPGISSASLSLQMGKGAGKDDSICLCFFPFAFSQYLRKTGIEKAGKSKLKTPVVCTTPSRRYCRQPDTGSEKNSPIATFSQAAAKAASSFIFQKTFCHNNFPSSLLSGYFCAASFLLPVNGSIYSLNVNCSIA